MKLLNQPRIILPLVRYSRPWYRIKLAFPLAILLGIGVWAFIFWCAAKVIRP